MMYQASRVHYLDSRRYAHTSVKHIGNTFFRGSVFWPKTIQSSFKFRLCAKVKRVLFTIISKYSPSNFCLHFLSFFIIFRRIVLLYLLCKYSQTYRRNIFIENFNNTLLKLSSSCHETSFGIIKKFGDS